MSAILFALPANANGLEELKKMSKECGKSNSDFQIYADEKHTKLEEDFDPAEQCKVNKGDEEIPESHNARAVTPEAWGSIRPKYMHDPRNAQEARKLGACRLAYKAIKDIYKAFHKFNKEYCQKITASMTNTVACAETSKKCETYYLAWKSVFESYQTQSKEFQETADRYLEAMKSTAQRAKKDYEKDLVNLETEMDKRRQDANAPPLETWTVVADRRDLKPSNGNGETKLLGKYYELLAAPTEAPAAASARGRYRRHAGPIILELDASADAVDKFRDDLKLKITRDNTLAEDSSKKIEAILSQIKKSGSEKDDLWTKAGGPGAMLGAGTQFIGANNQPPPTPNLSGGSAAPSLAAIAAAGAAGAALQNSFGSSKAAMADANDSPAINPGNAIAATSPLVENLGATESAANGTAPIGTLPTPDVKAEEVKTESAGGGYPAFGAGEGASRMVASGKKQAKAPAPAEGKVPEEALTSFSAGGMTPRHVPKTNNKISAGAEVANLLGQMKNLFNFDEGAPMGDGGAMHGAAPAGSAAANSGSAPAAGPGEEGEPSEEELAEEEGEAGGENREVQSAQFGRVDTTLFARVRSRHARAMEKGLVLYQLGERVE